MNNEKIKIKEIAVTIRQDDTVNDFSFFDTNSHSGPFIHGGYAPNGNFFGFVSESVFVLDNDNNNDNGYGISDPLFAQDCGLTNNLLVFISILLLIIVILMILREVKKKNE